MQTNFNDTQLLDPQMARSNKILRACVHCGFCTATCPTYQVLGDELDSPRGRIYLIKDMLENERIPDAKTVKHIDRCLSCLACMTTCPSGVHYMHLVDHAREYIETHYKRAWHERLLRWMLTQILPYPARVRIVMALGRPFRALARFMPEPRLRAMMRMMPQKLPPPSPFDTPQIIPAQGTRKMRVALMIGCVQRAVNPDINEATIRLLTRHGAEVVIVKQGCCGALSHHMGKTQNALNTAALNIKSFSQQHNADGLDAIVINTSGCGTTVKDYGHMFAQTPLHAQAALVSSLAKDVSEVLQELDLPQNPAQNLRVTYHAACSLQHGQKIKSAPKDLLRRAGFKVSEPEESHLCCGSAGTYNLMQPQIADQLKARKVSNIKACQPDIIAAGNLGCIMQIGGGIQTPVLHTVQLLDWATGGPKPAQIPASLDIKYKGQS